MRIKLQWKSIKLIKIIRIIPHFNRGLKDKYMKVEFNTSSQPNFQAKVAPRFINMMQSYINNGSNRIKNIYELNSKIEEINKKFGYNNYTIELVTNSTATGNNYSLVAVKDGKTINDGILILKYTSFRNLLNTFLEFKKKKFSDKMKMKRKFSTDNPAE